MRNHLGDFEQAIDHFHRSQRLNPFDQSQHIHWNMVGISYFGAGRYEEADLAADKALQARPSYPPGLRLKVATCGVLGRIDEGRACVRRLLAVDPKYSLAWIRDFWGPLMQHSPAALEQLIQGSRRVGVPEGPRMSG
jgi:tetratricopeptide (TPR) repeat protein